MVDKIGQLNQVSNAYQGAARPKDDVAAKAADKIEISTAGRAASVRQAVAQIVNGSPEIRTDRVREAREKLERGEYLTDKVIEAVADRIAASIVGSPAK